MNSSVTDNAVFEQDNVAQYQRDRYRVFEREAQDYFFYHQPIARYGRFLGWIVGFIRFYLWLVRR